MYQQLRTACSQNLLRRKLVAIEGQVKGLLNIAQKVILEQRRLSSHLTFIEQESIPFNQTTVTYPNFSYLNTSVIRMPFAKPHPLFLATFVVLLLAYCMKWKQWLMVVRILVIITYTVSGSSLADPQS